VTAAAYHGNADAAAIAARLRAAQRVVVLTHAKPDGDAIGSVLAVVRMARAIGAEAKGWLLGPVDHSLRAFLVGDEVGEQDFAAKSIDPDLVVIVDTGSWSQLDRFAEWVRARSDRTIIVDHHRSGDPAIASLRLIDTSCASTTQLLVGVADALALDLGGGSARRSSAGSAPGHAPVRAPGGAPISATASASGGEGSLAEALFIGLATDTGWFRFSNAGAAVFECAARLLRAGVEKDRLYRQIEETARPERLRLLARALSSLELHADGRAAIQTLTPDDFASCGGGAEDLSGVVNSPMAISSVEMSVLVSISEPGLVKLSFRSKPPMRAGGAFVDVDRLAARYGGGGHVHAAGAKVPGTIPSVLTRLREELRSLPSSTGRG